LNQHEYKTFFCSGCGYEVRAPVYCKNRFCSVCGRLRAKALRLRMQQLLTAVRPGPGETYKAITLHVRNQASLSGMVHFLNKAFRKLRSRALWRHNVSGGCFVVEITGQPGFWHAHIHIICLSRYIPWDHLLSEWRFLVGAGGIYIQKIKSQAILGYLTSYLTKGCQNIEQQQEISDELKNYRLFNVFGIWFKCLTKKKKKKFPCPKCGHLCWLPEWVINRMGRGWSKEKTLTPLRHDFARFQPP